jgi:hypothetical protein
MTYDGALVMPNAYVAIPNDEMEYVEGGAITASQKAWIIGVAIVSAVAIAAALWLGAWAVAAKIFGVALKTIVVKAGAAAVVGTLVAALGVGTATAWNIVNVVVKW